MFADFGTPVTGLRIRNDYAGIVPRVQCCPDEFVEAELFWAADLRDAVQRRVDSGDRHGLSDIGGGHRLAEH